MARVTQTGSGGVIQQNSSTLIPVKTLWSSNAKTTSKKRSNQTGAGVVQQNTPKLITLKSLRSSTSKIASKGRVSKSKPVQTGKGRRTCKPKVSVVPTINLKAYKKACAGKKVASKQKTVKKQTATKTKK